MNLNSLSKFTLFFLAEVD